MHATSKTSLLLFVMSLGAHAATPQEILSGYASQAKQESSAFKEFSASRGEQFYQATRTHSKGTQMSCNACHSRDPKGVGVHATTRKEIQPLAPVANKERLSDPAKVEKWFKRNCQDVLERACSAQEKGDFIVYLLSIK